MLRIFTILIFGGLIGAVTIRAQKTNDQSNDENAIRANVAQLVKGWNAKSGTEFAKPFAPDADYVVINGSQIKGREAIARGHQSIFETIYKNSTLALSVDSIRFLRPDVVVVHVSGSMEIVEGNSTRSGKAKMTLVMTKTDGKWEIVAFQNTGVQTN
jgi:uncharacterized protein (TIGR02246 family)